MRGERRRPDSQPYYQALQQIAHQWDIAADGITLLRNGLNHVFAGMLMSGTGTPIIIRITDDAHRTAQLIQAELDWLGFLRQHGCAVTRPLSANDGDLLNTLSTDDRLLHVVCFERFTGSPVTPGDPRQWKPELFESLGKTLGHIHRVTATFQPQAGVQRYPWYEETEFRRLAEYRGIVPNAVLERIQAHMTMLRDLPRRPGQYGLIHNDVYAENFLYAHGKVQLFDFDQSCYGWYLQDLLNPIYPHYVFPAVKIPDATTEDLACFVTHVVAGYRSEQTLTAEQLAMANALLQLKEIFVYLILNAQLAQWASTLGLTEEQLRASVTAMEHRMLTGAAVVELDFRSF